MCFLNKNITLFASYLLLLRFQKRVCCLNISASYDKICELERCHKWREGDKWTLYGMQYRPPPLQNVKPSYKKRGFLKNWTRQSIRYAENSRDTAVFRGSRDPFFEKTKKNWIWSGGGCEPDFRFLSFLVRLRTWPIEMDHSCSTAIYLTLKNVNFNA